MTLVYRLTSLFPLWALLGCGVAMLWPGFFASLKTLIVPLLGAVMFAMGMSLRPENFAEVLKRPREVVLGLTLQYSLMPILAWAVARLLGLDALLTAGLVLVGACPGGTASNVVCYLARGDLALSISLTTLSTVMAVAATPLLTWLLIGRTVPVPVADMFADILVVVLVPVLAGVLLNRLFGHALQPLKRLSPLLSVAAIALIIAVIVALNHDRLGDLALPVVIAVAAHNLLGLACGYLLARLLGFDQRVSRTLAIEVGMQNSGLGVALAGKYFAAAAALPGAVFSVWHNISGSALAAFWVRRDPQT